MIDGRPAIERAINPQCKPRRSRRAPRRAARKASPAARALILTIPQTQCLPPKGRSRMPAGTTDLNRFPFSNFKYFLTLFSKFFSSFPHGTCSLSVSHRYLALEGIYLPIRAAFPSNPTLCKRIKRHRHRTGRGSHPLCHHIPMDLHPGRVGRQLL